MTCHNYRGTNTRRLTDRPRQTGISFQDNDVPDDYALILQEHKHKERLTDRERQTERAGNSFKGNGVPDDGEPYRNTDTRRD